MCMSAFKIIFYFSFSFCHLFGILCTSMFSSKPICICIANIHFHFGFMCLPSLLIGFGSFPNVQSVPSNNYIPKEICMNFVTEFDGLPACHRRDSDILLHVKAKCQQDIIRQRERESPEDQDHDDIIKFTFVQISTTVLEYIFYNFVEDFHLFCFILPLCYISESNKITVLRH